MAKAKDSTSRLEALLKSPIAMAWRKTWNNYSNVSTMHGMKYIYDKEVSIYIRVIWLVTILIMLIFANRMAYSLYVDFIDDPIRLIIESDHTNTAKLLFPAVTVCPTRFFNQSKARELILTFNLPENFTASEIIQNLDQTYGFVQEEFKYNKTRISALQMVMKLNNYTASTFFKKAQWNFNELFFRCRFQSTDKNCSAIFQISKTFGGICYSFNAHESGIFSTQFMSKRHTLRQGLSFILKDVDMHSHSKSFQVIIHEAHVCPDEFSFRKLLHKNEELLLRSEPTETICSREVWRRLTVEERKCALGSEIKLRFFTEYHRQNCLSECRISIMQKICGCVPFYVFREESTLVCDFKHIPCISDNYERLLSMQNECNCVHSCEKVEFSVRLTSASIEDSIDAVDPFYENILANFTVVHVYIQSQLYRRIRRDIVWNIVSIAGNLGNCYSVFVGISALSVLQFLYYFTFVLKRNYYN